MRLSSFEFIAFLALVVALFHLSKGRASQFLLLAASAVFYASFLHPLWFLALLAVVVATWAIGLAIQNANDAGKSVLWLRLGVALSLALLCSMKYLGLTAQTLNLIFRLHLPVVEPVLFIGLSYYVFQSISYLSDIYFGSLQAERSLSWVALYLGFFPKIVQGPIERAGTLLPQLKAEYRYDADLLRRGALLFCWGLFKKVVVADTLAKMVDGIFIDLAQQSAPTLLAGAWIFALQLFCDFSGYTDMALGAASLFNIKLTDNFNEPYLARSMKDFWRRWHITLSTWILDYVFQPLHMAFRYGGNLGLAGALFIAFFFMGLWHGATVVYVVFGLTHGVFMAASILYRPWQKRIYVALNIAKAPWLPWWQTAFTLNLVVLSFVLFRAGTLANAASFYRGLAHGWTTLNYNLLIQPLASAQDRMVLALSVIIAAAGELARRRAKLESLPLWLRFSAHAALIAWMLFFGHLYAQKQFIYAQF